MRLMKMENVKTAAYEIKSIKKTEDGMSFKVEVQSEFLKDSYGDPISEFYQFPIQLLENKAEWLHTIDRAMIDRYTYQQSQKEAAAAAKVPGAQAKPSETELMQQAKAELTGKRDITKNVNDRIKFLNEEQVNL